MYFFSVFTCSKKHYSVPIACQCMLENAFLVSVCWFWACICTVYANTLKPRFFKGDLCNNNAVMESRNLVSVLRPIVASPGLKGFRSSSWSRRLHVSRLLILQRNSIEKFLQFTIYCLLYLHVRNNQNNSENARNLKLHCNGHHTPVTWLWLHEHCSTGLLAKTDNNFTSFKIT